MTYLVTGATGKAGAAVVDALIEAGARVRALVRDPRRAPARPDVEVVPGDLADPASLGAALRGVDGVHLMAGATHPDVVDKVVAAGVRRVSVLWAGAPGPVEERLAGTDLAWTGLEPTSFFGNTLEWASGIRERGEVAEPFVDVREAMVDEADVGAVAAACLLGEGHAGRRYPLTGAEPISVRDRVAVLARALGRELDLRSLSEREARDCWARQGYDDELIDLLVAWQQRPSAETERVEPTVADLLGRPPRSFEQWAVAHRSAFRTAWADTGSR